MTEDSTSGVRTMSRQNFSDRVIPTPWYMSSFLYRFYNGSSQLKVIPYTPGVVADSFLSFDENTEDQTDVASQLAYGQPLFQQIQQVSNAFEVRTPYYRGIRCDVVDSNQVPVLGDVRTNIRCRNLANFGGTNQASPLYEAAGDDFNFFFMIGPPPMSDIRNLKTISSFPTGQTVEVDTTLAANVNAVADKLSFFPVAFTPLIEQDDTAIHNITESSISTVTVTYTDASTEDVPITQCTLLQNTTPRGFFQVPINTAKTPELTVTTAAVQALGSFSVVTDAPLA